MYEGEANATLFYPSLADGTIKITYASENVFTPLTKYNFYAEDQDGAIQTDILKKSNYPFFTASVEIVNDYSDNISLSLNWPNFIT